MTWRHAAQCQPYPQSPSRVSHLRDSEIGKVKRLNFADQRTCACQRCKL